MANSRFLNSLEKLPLAHKDRIKNQLSAWKKLGIDTGVDCAQIAHNIESETALSISAFSNLLRKFSDSLETGSTPLDAWKIACKDSHLAGHTLKSPHRPTHLGRAAKFDDYANRLEKQFSDRKIKHALRKHVGSKKPSAAIQRQLSKANLGGPIIWACFDPNLTDDPFAGLPRDTSSIQTALGLGNAITSGPFLLLIYNAGESSTLLLHRPTVADAETYSYFRPLSKPAAKWGFTHPLTPNPGHLKGRPEVVHRQITGKSLIFPYFMTA